VRSALAFGAAMILLGPVAVSCLVSVLRLATSSPTTAIEISGARSAIFNSKMTQEDADLWASLRSRLESPKPHPLGLEDVVADSMGPKDVIAYVMNTLVQDMDAGISVLLSFSELVPDGSPVDFLGQLQPGGFGRGPAAKQAFIEYIKGEKRYRTLTVLDEWKPMGSPDFSDMSRRVAQKCLVRRDGGNWEDFFINMRLATVDDSAMAKRWVIVSVYKQNAG